MQEACCVVPLHVATLLQLMVQGVIYIGHPYDVGVKLGGTDDRVILVAKDFEDVQPPGMLRQACEAAAGCPGYIDELDTGLCWPSMFPLERKGWYLFHPRPAPQGEPILSWLCWQTVVQGNTGSAAALCMVRLPETFGSVAAAALPSLTCSASGLKQAARHYWAVLAQHEPAV